jgi:hypothetical protein
MVLPNLRIAFKLIKQFGASPISTQGLTILPYAFGWCMVITFAWHSDYSCERGYHVMAASFMAFVGYVILATSADKSHIVGFFALFLVIGGIFSLFPLVM